MPVVDVSESHMYWCCGLGCSSALQFLLCFSSTTTLPALLYTHHRRPLQLSHTHAWDSDSKVASASYHNCKALCAGVVLGPSDSESRCDNRKVAGPLVQHDGEKYLMWYYCQGTTTHNPPTMLPLGDVALATSPDGFNLTRQEVRSAAWPACSITTL